MRIVLTNQEIANYYACSLRTATERKKEINRALGFPEARKLTAYAVAEYERCNVNDVFKNIQ